MTHHNGGRVLIKFGGNALSGEGDLDRFAQDIASLSSSGFRPILVHGGGPEISQEMERRGLPVRKVAGLRVTDQAALDIADQVLTRINREIVEALQRAGVKAVGMPGSQEGSVVACKMPPVRTIDEHGQEVLVDLEMVGQVGAVEGRFIESVLSSEAVPVIYPICADPQGIRYNVNADTLAAHVARAIGAKEMVLVTDVPGLLTSGKELIPSVTLREIDSLIASGTITEGMVPKVDACRTALSYGVRVVHIIGGKEPHALARKLLQGERIGTRVVSAGIDEVKELDHRYLFQNYGRQDLCFERGEGEFLYDLAGRRYIDLVAGIAVNSLGYAHPAVVAAVCEQVARLTHVSNLYFVREQAEAAEALASIVPRPLGTTLFCNSGAEANEAALKLAVKATGRERVVSTHNSFHGRTSSSLAATGQPKYRLGFEPLLSNAFDFIDYGRVEQLKSSIHANTAAFICEPIQGEGGIIPAGQEFFHTARDLCDEKGALFIVDEVQTGMGRTGRWFGFQHYGVVPDIITLAKALGNGYPIGACMSTPEIAATFKPGMHGTTFGGNPLGCVVARTVIETMKRDRLVERSAEVGRRWAQDLRGMVIGAGKVTDVRGQGLMIGLEMGEDAKSFQSFALENGILVNVCAGRVVRLVPPLIISESSVGELNGCLEKFLHR
jgi:acetylornithine/N-succinyldiaminopimelate aminotransferase